MRLLSDQYVTVQADPQWFDWLRKLLRMTMGLFTELSLEQEEELIMLEFFVRTWSMLFVLRRARGTLWS